MPSVNIDIDIDEFVDSLGPREVKKLVEYLQDNEYIDKYSKFILDSDNRTNLSDAMWFEACEKLLHNRLQLTMEETQLVEKISSRFL